MKKADGRTAVHLSRGVGGAPWGPQTPRRMNQRGPERRKPKTRSGVSAKTWSLVGNRKAQDERAAGESADSARGAAGPSRAGRGGRRSATLRPASLGGCKPAGQVTRLVRAGPQVWTQLALGAR